MKVQHTGKILLVEGKRKNNDSFSEDLAWKGYDVVTVENGNSGIKMLNQITPNAVIINAASLRTNGLRMVNRFRSLLPEVHIVLIIAEDEEIQSAPQANTLLRLPFTVQKLSNRLKNLTETTNKNLMVVGPLQLNLQTKMVSCNGREAHLTPRLCRLLKQMMESPNQVLTREDLFRQVWDTDYTGDTRTLDVHISWLREAIEEDRRNPTLILTERAVGYKLNL